MYIPPEYVIKETFRSVREVLLHWMCRWWRKGGVLGVRWSCVRYVVTWYLLKMRTRR
jgi:hypothetical protein